MGFVKRYGNNADYRRRLEVKLQKSSEHIEELAEWLYVHTSDIESTEYERRYAEYNSELRRHDIFSDELQCYDNPAQALRDNPERWQGLNWDCRNKIRY